MNIRRKKDQLNKTWVWKIVDWDGVIDFEKTISVHKTKAEALDRLHEMSKEINDYNLNPKS